MSLGIRQLTGDGLKRILKKAHTAICTHVDQMNPVVVRNAHHFPRHRVRPQEELFRIA